MLIVCLQYAEIRHIRVPDHTCVPPQIPSGRALRESIPQRRGKGNKKRKRRVETRRFLELLVRIELTTGGCS